MASAWEEIGAVVLILFPSWFIFLVSCGLLYSVLPRNRTLSWQGCFYFVILSVILPVFGICYLSNSLPAEYHPGSILSTILCLILPASFNSIIHMFEWLRIYCVTTRLRPNYKLPFPAVYRTVFLAPMSPLKRTPGVWREGGREGGRRRKQSWWSSWYLYSCAYPCFVLVDARQTKMQSSFGCLSISYQAMQEVEWNYLAIYYWLEEYVCFSSGHVTHL